MDREEKIELINTIVDMSRSINEQSHQFKVLFGIYFASEGGVPKLIDYMFSKNIDFVSRLTVISKDSIEWFIYENDCGDEKMTASYEGDEYVIDSVGAFVDFESLNVG